MATAAEPSAFKHALRGVLGNWTALQLAITHGFGGAHSQEKGAWLVDALDQWFTENRGLYPDEVEEFLADVMNTEFETIIDDGSIREIAQSICQFYRLCEEGQIQQVMERLGSMPKVSLQNCVDATKEEDIEDDDDDDEECPQLQPQLQQPPGGSTSNGASSSSETKSEDVPMEEEEEEDDGWTVVKKNNKKR